ncbi:MAG: hypothetical protein QGH73_09770 [Rhodospirillales bacterium]|jgi:hypothetical protein|nr:hypothetical protein [Rhodospirillales bacterium]MDP6645963.1 hypothetical protein [Rhodospirillales bacterium]MDP6841953.1 hypothetical protein [Rhodospirillales bacterium]|tara:strand:- start:1911 stop:2819 length:909 start_codon:yes stop_codon:yes gene_type:complete
MDRENAKQQIPAQQYGLMVAGNGGGGASQGAAKAAKTGAAASQAPQFSVSALSRALAQTVVSTFTDRLKLEAQRHGGYLTVSDISQLADEFDRKRAQLEQVFQQSFEQYVRARERSVFDHARAYPFDRLIVNTFEEMFLKERAKADAEDAVTRRFLPGFFLAMDMMIGKDMVEEFQEACRKIVTRLSAGKEQSFNWQMLYDDKAAQDLCLDALAAFAPYFDDWKKRRDWFLPLINGNLDAADDWELTPKGLGNLVGAMFSKLKAGLADPEIRAGLEKRHGRGPCAQLDLTLGRLAGAGITFS